jgi:H+-transporting ATPase
MPADCRIISKDGALQLDQSAITGESEPVTKICGDICYASTNIIRGDAFLIAIATGKKTFLGRAASIVRPSPEDPECNRRIKRLDLRRILAALAAAVTLAFVVSVTQTGQALFTIKTLELAFTLAVAGLPMPLPAIIGAIRTQSLTRYTRMGLLFKDSCRPCLEFLASVDIFCVDKTDTLTQNRLQAYEPFCMDGFDPEELMLTACLTADRKKHDVDAIDRSLLRALKHHPRAGADLGRFQVLDYQPFSTLTKMTSSLVESPSGERIFCVKGAPKFILDRAWRDDPNVGETKDRYVDAVNDATRRGFRTLGVARQREGGRWELLGLIRKFWCILQKPGRH